MYIKDLESGEVRKYGTDHHDSLMISNDGKCLYYEHLQNGEGSEYGDYRFVTDKDGFIPAEDEVLIKHGADAYFNIGGFNTEHVRQCSKKAGIYEAISELKEWTRQQSLISRESLMVKLKEMEKEHEGP
jgi:hypothetical protein